MNESAGRRHEIVVEGELAGRGSFGVDSGGHLLARRRRKIGDPTLIYWRTSMISLLAGAVFWLLV